VFVYCQAVDALYTLMCMKVYHREIGRTNIEIDDELIARVMQRYGFRTKREAVDYALRKLVRKLSREEVLALQGMGWEGDLEAMRETRFPEIFDRP
jgi:Arc/MetJ family transcription regulator